MNRNKYHKRKMQENPQAILFQGSLRDWFAGMAIQGFIQPQNNFGTQDLNGVAEWAYTLADAMIAQKRRSEK